MIPVMQTHTTESPDTHDALNMLRALVASHGQSDDTRDALNMLRVMMIDHRSVSGEISNAR